MLASRRLRTGLAAAAVLGGAVPAAHAAPAQPEDIPAYTCAALYRQGSGAVGVDCTASNGAVEQGRFSGHVELVAEVQGRFLDCLGGVARLPETVESELCM